VVLMFELSCLGEAGERAIMDRGDNDSVTRWHNASRGRDEPPMVVDGGVRRGRELACVMWAYGLGLSST